MNFEIQIGKHWNMELKMQCPAKCLKISEDQKNILILFAEKRIDEKCNPIYKIGDCEFTIGINFDDTPYFGQNANLPQHFQTEHCEQSKSLK